MLCVHIGQHFRIVSGQRDVSACAHVLVIRARDRGSYGIVRPHMWSMPGRPLLRWQRIDHAVWCGLVGERRCGQLHAVRGWLLGRSTERFVHGVCGQYILGPWQ